jgi:hypothetical protein
LNNAKQGWTAADVNAYFYNRIVDGNHIFDGCLPLATAIGAVAIRDDNVLTLHPSLVPALVNERYLQDKFLEMLFAALKEDDLFHEIFCSNNISYDIIYRLIQVDISAFQFRYANFRRLLLSFDFLYPHPDGHINKLIVTSKYKRLFDREIMPEIKKRKLGVGELELQLEQNRIHGENAEIFVETFERRRLAGHPALINVERISIYDAGAGYDIVSFNDLQSVEADRFIEVKSFAGIPSFFWSRNEIDVARIKKEAYFLYLVDRDQMSISDYEPMIIRNPHEEVINSEIRWAKRVESYYVKINVSC